MSVSRTGARAGDPDPDNAPQHASGDDISLPDHEISSGPGARGAGGKWEPSISNISKALISINLVMTARSDPKSSPDSGEIINEILIPAGQGVTGEGRPAGTAGIAA